MIQMLKTLCITLFFGACLYAQTGQDSINLSTLVQKQINQVQSEKAKPVETPKTAMTTETNKAGVGIPENMFIVIFALIEIIAGGLIIRYYFMKRQQKSEPEAQLQPVKAEAPARRKMTKEEFAKLRTEVTCQLTLIKTQDELNRQAKKMKVGSGELELAMRLQNMAGSN